jgi:hypothetical protein
LDLGLSGIGQYYCVKLLREMEQIDSDAEDEASVIAQGGVEMISLPENLCVDFFGDKWVRGLPDDIYTLCDMMRI